MSFDLTHIDKRVEPLLSEAMNCEANPRLHCLGDVGIGVSWVGEEADDGDILIFWKFRICYHADDSWTGTSHQLAIVIECRVRVQLKVLVPAVELTPITVLDICCTSWCLKGEAPTGQVPASASVWV